MAQSATISARVAPTRVLAVASFGAFLAFLDATVVNVAFPSIRESFPDSSVSQLSWVLNAYNIAFASFLIVFGRFADLMGRKRLFSTGTLVFTAASVWCAASGSLEMLVAARTVQALGAAMLVPASLALVVEAFPAERRSHAVGLWGASAAVAAGLGPPIGGALVQWGDWRWAFLINLPFGVTAFWLNRNQLVESRAPGRRRLPDLRGALVLAGSMSFVTLGIVQGNDWGWSSARVLGSFALAALLGAGFVASSRSHPQPLLDPALLRIRPFAVGNLVTIVAGMGFYAYLLTNILWLQYVWGYNVLEAGLALVPGAVVAAVTAAVLGELAQHHGYRKVIVPGALVWCAAYLWYAVVVDPNPAFLTAWLPGQILSGLGVGATLPVLGSASLAAVPGGRFATASAVLSSARQLGGVLGVAILVVIVGTPTPATVVDTLPRGWLFCAACFAVCAVGALLLGDPRTHARVEDEPTPTIATQVPPVFAPSTDEASYQPIPADLLARLDAAGTLVALKAGEWLFREGDAAGSMFVVHSGRLDVLIDDEPVRELGGGAIVGELALLAGEPTRSASVQARRDTTLREVDRAAFERVLSAQPSASLALASGLAVQLRAPVRHEESSHGAVVVGIVAAHQGALLAEIHDALRRSLEVTLDVASLDLVEAGLLAAAEIEHDRVLVWSEDVGSLAWDSCIRQADRLVVVASSWVDPPSWQGPPGADLVLVGKVAGAAVVDAWCAALTPRRVWNVQPGGAEEALQPLVRALTGRSLGVVLAGGGARAMASIGVLAELEAAGLTVDRVAGCSLGAIVGGLYARGSTAAEVHEAAYAEFVRHNPFGDYTLPMTSLSKGQRTASILRRHLGDGRIEALPREFHCVSTDLLSRTPYLHESGPLWEAVTASARLPVLFPPIQVDGHLLVDGSVLDNLPSWLLTRRREGPVIAVHIGMGGGGHRPASTGVSGTHPANGVPRQRVPSLGETLLRTMTIGGAGSTDDARAAGVYLVTPPSMGVGLLEFHQLDRMVEAGRLAARELLETTGGLFQPSH